MKIRITRGISITSLLVIALFCGGGPALADPVTASLASDGRALLPIVISPTASDATRQAAQTLGSCLEKITGAHFELKQGDGRDGVVVGRAEDFAAFKGTFGPRDLLTQEDYLLRSHTGGVDLIGASDLGVRHAIWDFLYRLGYRRYFPNPDWEIVPRRPDLRIAVDAREHPDFLWRSMWINATAWHKPRWVDSAPAKKYQDLLQRRQLQWKAANRIGDPHGDLVQWGHAWNKIYKAEQPAFERHPEYLALVGGKRQVNATHKKFCLSNAGLRRLVVKYALEYFKNNPQTHTVSIEPSDLRGWCECDQCRAMGSHSDQMAILANEVVDGVRAQYPHKYVAFLAYSTHADPPHVKLHPGIIVGATTALTHGEVKSFDQRVRGWRQQGAIVGIYRYLGMWMWDYGAPHAAEVAQLDRFPSQLMHYHQLGLNIFHGEASGGWAAKGLSYYLASRILWNADDARHVDALVDDFIDNCFQGVQKPMRRFYGLLNGVYDTRVPPFDETYIRNLYECLQTAWRQSSDPRVKARLADLVLYVRYLELYRHHLGITDPAERQADFERIVKYAYRVYAAQMIHSTFIVRFKFSTKTDPFNYQIPNELLLKNSWKAYQGDWDARQPFSDDEIEAFMAHGIADLHPTSLNWKVRLAKPLETTDRPTAVPFREVGQTPNRVLVYPLRDGPVRLKITSVQVPHTDQNTDDYGFSWKITSAGGRVMKVGDAMQRGQVITVQAQAESPFYFYAIGNFTLEVENAPAAIQTNLDRGRLHLFRRGVTLYVYVPEKLPSWNLGLYTMAPGETARVEVTSPNGESAAILETGGKTREQSARLSGPPGVWKIHVGRARTGIPYDYVLTFDKRLSPWASIDPAHPLIVTREP